ncbi:MAG TPA: hypothetical protein VKT77_19715, partial [Chthonomonadaceae bacterium]|nr:hypothetical protein [Chthonomonadaceae bacterium]
DGNGVVTCSVDIMAGATVFATVTVHQPITVVAPDYTYTSTPYNASYVDSDQSGIVSGTPESDMAIQFHGRVRTPDLFGSNDIDDSYAGNWKLVQLCNILEIETFWSGLWHTQGTNNEYWLDNMDPYDTTYGPGVLFDAHWMSEGDVPATDDQDKPSLGFIGTAVTCQVENSFKMYMMYLPPPADADNPDVQWVPLSRIRWFWFVNAWLQYVYWGSWQLGGGLEGMYVGAQDPERMYLHPTWENKWINN